MTALWLVIALRAVAQEPPEPTVLGKSTPDDVPAAVEVPPAPLPVDPAPAPPPVEPPPPVAGTDPAPVAPAAGRPRPRRRAVVDTAATDWYRHRAPAPVDAAASIPAPAPAAPVPTAEEPPAETSWEKPLLPRGPLAFLGLIAGTLLGVLGTMGLERLSHRLRATGLLPAALRGAVGAIRVVSVVFVALALAAVAPASWLPWLGWSLLGALVVGLWVLRASVRDVVSGMVLAFEGRVRPGAIVHMDDVVGVVQHRGLRVTWIRDERDRTRGVPHHRFLDEEVEVEEGRWARVDVEVLVPWDGDLDLVRERVAEAALVSPWRAPGAVPEVRRGAAPGAWRVSVRILDLRFAERHRDTVRDLVGRAFALDGAPVDPGIRGPGDAP